MEVVYAALVTGGFAVVVAWINKATKRVTTQNTAEHMVNKAVLDRIESKVDVVSTSLTDHLSWHIEHPVNSKGAA